jgi:hypothetical protein
VVLQNLAGYPLVSRQTRIRGFTPFDAAAGGPGRQTWATQVHAGLAAVYPDESEALRLDRWIGVALGYPNQAIEDAVQWQREGKGWQWLAEAELPATDLYRGALPSFRSAPVQASDPGIAETMATWEQMLEAVYASAWHQQLMRIPVLQAALQERERLRTFTRS